MPDSANFSASGRPGAELPGILNRPGKIKNLNLLKWSKNETGQKKTFFYFCSLKLVLMDSELNSQEKKLVLTKKLSVVPGKEATLENLL